MPPFSGGNCDLLPENCCFIQIGGIFLPHTYRAAAAPDIACHRKQFLYRNQLHRLVACGLRSLFQIQFAANRNAKYMNAGPFSPGDQRLKNLLRWESQTFGCMDAPKVLLVIFIKMLPAGDAGLFYQAYSVGLSSHLITMSIIQYTVNNRKRMNRKIFGYPRKKHLEVTMNNKANAEMAKQEQERVVELGADITKSSKGNIYTLTIIGQVEGHMIAPETVKTTKYEHVLPLLAGIEESDDIDGLLLLLNTVGGDIEAGLAIAEMIAGMKKPTVSLVLGGGHSIGIPLAVCTKKSFITHTASMTVHPVRMTGLVVGAPQTFRYFQRIQEQIADFVTANSNISRERFEQYMMATGEMATDVGTILYGKEAVSSGLIDRLGGLNDALAALHRMIDKQKGKGKN